LCQGIFCSKFKALSAQGAVITDRSISGLPQGVAVRVLTPHRDVRGGMTEIYRESWNPGRRSVQFNAVTSAAGVLRGVQVHVRHADHVVLLAGRMVVGLHDMRPSSPTAMASCLFELDAAEPRAVVIPVGVAHGFYFPAPSVLVYGLSHGWEPAEEIGCRWDCKELGLAWPTSAPVLSERDATAQSYSDSVETFGRAWAALHGAMVRARLRPIIDACHWVFRWPDPEIGSKDEQSPDTALFHPAADRSSTGDAALRDRKRARAERARLRIVRNL
jgi:dTDP-4-dehydrorhamnose 3,5-epimerase